MDERSERLARNEALFREVNERIQEISALAGAEDSLEVLCECGRRDCTRPIEITRAEYELVRTEPDRFLVAPGHADAEVERVVLQADGFDVVEKLGTADRVARSADPRS